MLYFTVACMTWKLDEWVHFTTAVINGADSSVNDLHLEVSLFLIYIFLIDIFFFFAAGFFDCPWLRKPVKLLRSWLVRCAVQCLVLCTRFVQWPGSGRTSRRSCNEFRCGRPCCLQVCLRPVRRNAAPSCHGPRSSCSLNRSNAQALLVAAYGGWRALQERDEEKMTTATGKDDTFR